MGKQLDNLRNWGQFIKEDNNEDSPELVSFEYVDRDRDGKLVQVGMFQKITSKDQVKPDDRFICPQSKEYKQGIVDAHSKKPILLFPKNLGNTNMPYHLAFEYIKGGMSSAHIAWDLCYLLRDDI